MKNNLLILGCATLLTLTSCGKEEKAEALNEVEELPLVEIDIAHTRPVEISRSYTANVKADNINNISPAMSNRIESIKVDVGDVVSRGQLLAVLDSSTADQQLINMNETERQYKLAKELLEIGAGKQNTVDQLEAQLNAQRAQYRNTITNTELRSPIDGVVISRNYDPGDMSGQLPILVVGQTRPNVKVIINVNEADLAVVEKNMNVDIRFDSYPDEVFTGKVSSLTPSVDVNSRTFPVEVLVANHDGRIIPGMFARVDIKLGTRDNVVVPDRAVVKQNGSAKKFVYTYSNGQVSFKPVELGQRINDSYELISGIENGDTVVISGQARLADGVKVELKNIEN